jgi:oxygen-dependent protoporphyrinogen oxidase
MERLVDRLQSELAAAGVALRTGTPVTEVEPAGSGYRVVTAGGGLATPDTIDAAADAVVVTLPAFAAAHLLPPAANDLAAIRYVSVAVTTLSYRPESVPIPLDGAGFLVPRVDGRLMTACTFTTTKWPSTAAAGLVLVRASAGRAGDDRPDHLDDNALVARLHDELAAAIGVIDPPVASLVSRWTDGFPQYQPGHTRRVNRIEASLTAEMPGVAVAGAAYRGLGIAACIRQAEEAAAKVRTRLTAGSPRP